MLTLDAIGYRYAGARRSALDRVSLELPGGGGYGAVEEAQPA